MQLSEAVQIRIDYFLKKKGLSSLWDLYKTSGVPKSTINALLGTEKNKLPRLPTLLHICEGLDFMLRDSKLYKRIPDDVRIQYEILFANLRSELEKNIDLIKEHLEEIKKDPKPVIHDMISAATEED